MTRLPAAAAHELLLQVVPRFETRVAACCARRGSAKPGLCNELGELADYVAELIRAGDTDVLPALLAAIERLLVEGDDDEVQDAAATCFLESLQNISNEEIARSWVPLLGEASRSHCKAWDEFTGVETPGL